MGKRGKKQRHMNQKHQNHGFYNSDEETQTSLPLQPQEDEEGQQREEQEEDDENGSGDNFPSKFQLYQESVQEPKGDISYLLKFFLMYVGGRVPLHLQEDFCGTALLSGPDATPYLILPSTEWLRNDARRTAVGVDLDDEALMWCLENNINKIGTDVYSRLSLLHGNVLQPMKAKNVKQGFKDLMRNVTLSDSDECSETGTLASATETGPEVSSNDEHVRKNYSLFARDIVCAFNYSCCCLQKRSDLVLYFKNVLGTLSKNGGIFVMDVYGGTSSECELRLQRRFPNFTYVWEQTNFDIVHRTTRISLHFNPRNKQRKLRHAFSYDWRLWSLPEVKDCLEEAGFKSVHFWIRKMPDTSEVKNSEGFEAGRDAKYEEVSTFHQQDAWNAYIVGVAK
ncbi:hypothetical protein GIB67_012881 [Kingdonia uniflora]|uniref:S-adenosyl-L-methionine-dependent methyltransferase superfamily protein n=1 Tax=Kingdonia uniflora TaxID=39325 RepID=A0A7J7NG30_9MAGN|nr:hypothetical protein GIB67_012881 [Kingdonia uniflora]